VEPVSWRDGLHITGTQIWCDALRAREICFLSRADAVPSARHGQIIATAETVAMLDGGKDRGPETELAVPLGRPFTLGTVRLELLRSGVAIGSASLVVDIDSQRLMYAGDVAPNGADLGGAADLRKCDTLILGTRYGDPRFDFEPVDTVASRLIDFVGEQKAAGRATVVLVNSVGRAMDMVARLGSAGLELSGHRAICLAAQRLRRSGLALAAVRRANAKSGVAPGRVLLWPTSARDALDRVVIPPATSIALLSGDAGDANELAFMRASHGFVWGGSADYESLLGYIAACEPSRIFTTGRFAETMANQLTRRDRPATALGPPVQMNLWG